MMMMVMRVARHKTAHQGPTNIVMSMDDHKLVRKYVNRIRQKQDPICLWEELFLLPGGKPVNNCKILMQRLGKKYGISVETPVKDGGDSSHWSNAEEASFVQRHMSHTPATAANYYQAITGRKEAAKAHLLRRKLEATKSKKESA